MEKLREGHENCIKIVHDVKKGAGSKPPRGKNYFDEPFCNIGILAKKKSGKTTLVANIIEKCAGPDTKVIIFCPNVFKDQAYKAILDMLEKRQIDYEAYEHFIDDDGLNLVDEIIAADRARAREEKEDKKGEGPPTILKAPKIILDPRFLTKDEQIAIHIQKMYGGSIKPEPLEPVESKTIKKSKYQELEYIFVFDDLSKLLRNKSIEALSKINRHLKSKVIFSFHGVSDLGPITIGQLDYLLIFGKQPEERIREVKDKLSIAIPFETLLEFYKKATEKEYNFLYIDVAKDEYRKNFA